MLAIQATPPYSRGIEATAELLTRLRIDAMFVGGVARAAWMGAPMEAGAIDVLALMAAPQKGQVAMMASNRGFRVDREELDQTDELDLIPLHYLLEDGEVRVHVLLASNALYARMINAGVPAVHGEREIRVPRAEDLALLLLMAEDQEALTHLTSLPEFDLAAFRERLASIGLSEWTGVQ
jgi:hypothetical protein